VRVRRRLPALQRHLDAGVISSDAARASVASWYGLAKHADAFRLSRAIFAARDVANIGKRLLGVTCRLAVRRSAAPFPAPRACRCGFITRALDNSASLDDVQRAAGHADAATTKL
jgi:site-specific recombinase XerC